MENQKPGTIILFTNSYKKKEKECDFKGTLITNQGEVFHINAWEKVDKKGNKFLSGSVQSDAERQEWIDRSKQLSQEANKHKDSAEQKNNKYYSNKSQQQSAGVDDDLPF